MLKMWRFIDFMIRIVTALWPATKCPAANKLCDFQKKSQEPFFAQHLLTILAPFSQLAHAIKFRAENKMEKKSIKWLSLSSWKNIKLVPNAGICNEISFKNWIYHTRCLLIRKFHAKIWHLKFIFHSKQYKKWVQK